MSDSGFENGLQVSATVAVLVGLAALIKTKLSVIAKALDVAYDVATYMRVPHGSPGDKDLVEPPRRKILRRYAALINHIQAVQGPERIVIAAHSQGSIYTLALLFGDEFRDRADRQTVRNGVTWPLAPRVISATKAPGTAPGPRERPPRLTASLTLLTAGCPVLQTYAPNFPGQYDWPSDTQLVRAELIRLGRNTTWRNVYRSGDYFGRALWSGQVCDPLAPGAPLQEFCLGAGHHTGYWGDPLFAKRVLELL